jgi:endoglycosylceramidase
LWDNASAPDGLGLSDHYAQAWQQVAARFSGNTDIIGYEVINEPWPGSGWLAANLGSDFFGRQQLTPFYNQVIAAIRSVDPTTTVYVEPPNPGASEIPMVLGLHVSLGTIDDPDTVLSYHGYCGGLTPICGFIANRMATSAQHYARRHDMPTMLTEFGATDDLTILALERSGAASRNIGWIEWAYSGIGDVTGSPDIEWLVRDPGMPLKGDNVDAAKLALLAQPYPQVISGIPQSWSFTDGTMTLRYSTRKADGTGDFAPRSQTVIAVPEIAFPAGYSVAVTGGHVVSAAGAPVLLIASDAGAKTVEVVVTGATARTPEGTGGGVFG